MDNYLSFDTKIGPRNNSIAKLEAFFAVRCLYTELNDGATESTRSIIGLPWQYCKTKWRPGKVFLLL